LRDWLFDNDKRIAELLQRETGKPPLHRRNVQRSCAVGEHSRRIAMV
jgi:hypothetical protein